MSIQTHVQGDHLYFGYCVTLRKENMQVNSCFVCPGVPHKVIFLIQIAEICILIFINY